MKKIIIISSHFPPSNLTAVHRAKTFVNNLSILGWEPILLTVNQKYYEERLDLDLVNLIKPTLRIEKVNAFPITKIRMIGDIGIRSLFQLYIRAIKICRSEKIDFIYILIPSFYISLLGRILFSKFKIPYGIDYIDPWVHFFPGSEKIFSRHWLSTKLSKLLEPIAVKRASLITSVSDSYIEPIFERNQKLKNTTKMLSFPYGWNSEEKNIIQNYKPESQLFLKNDKIKLVYTGAFLPHSVNILREWLTCIKNNIKFFNDVEIHFIGTGVPQSSPKQLTITSIAKEYNLYEKVIFEHPNRISYFDVLYHISIADGLFILGSSEAHYTPSKLFNAFIADKPIFAILHPHSSASKIIEKTEWGLTCLYSEEHIDEFNDEALQKFKVWKNKTMSKSWSFNTLEANSYSAIQLTEKLATALNNLV